MTPQDDAAATKSTLDTSGGIAAGLYQVIQSDVIAGRLVSGQRLAEAALSRQYKVSRSPVREALASLERDGLVQRRGTSVFVRERSMQEVLEIYEVRIYLEGAIAKDAAERRHPYDRPQLEGALAYGWTVDADDRIALLKANRLFHDALAHASRNTTLIELQDRLTAQVSTLPSTTLSVPGRWEEAQREHALITDAVSRGDADAARAVAEMHMAKSRDIRMRLYEESVST